MTPVEMADSLEEIQDMFKIREELKMCFRTEEGQFHVSRIKAALKRYGLRANIETLSLLYERIGKVPATGAKLVDAIIVEIEAAAEGEVIPPPVAPTNDSGCRLCHKGIVILPLPGGIHNQISDRAVYCDCGQGQFLWQANGRTSLCLASRPDLKAKAFSRQREERAASGSTLIRFGIDPEAEPEVQARQYRRSILGMRDQVTRGVATSKTAETRPITPRTVSEARELLAGVKAARSPASLPEHLNPDRLALAAYANGEDRSESY